MQIHGIHWSTTATEIVNKHADKQLPLILL